MDNAILKTLPLVACAAREVLITEGQPLQGIYFLESGEVEVVKGTTLIAEIFDAGAVFGEMSYLLGVPPTATVRALTPSTFRHVAQPAEFLRQHPEMALYMAGILARRLDSLNRYLIDIKHQFVDRADHLGIIDEVLDSLMNKHPRALPRRSAGD
jgi:CRP-like cAMP-binding protein